LPTTVRFSDEFQTHSRIGLLWTTFKRLTPLRGDSESISPTNLAEEAFFQGLQRRELLLVDGFKASGCV
jgi:hypothetical protein